MHATRTVLSHTLRPRPIPVPKGLRPGDPGFDSAAGQLVDATVSGLQQMYDRHKVDYGWADRELSIE